MLGESSYMSLYCFCMSWEWDNDLPIILNYLFKVVRIMIRLRRQNVYLRSKGQPHLLSITKDSGALRSEFLYCNAKYCMSRCHLVLFALPYGNWILGEQCKNTDTLATSTALSNKLYFISDPEFSCLLTSYLISRVKSQTSFKVLDSLVIGMWCC